MTPGGKHFNQVFFNQKDKKLIKGKRYIGKMKNFYIDRNYGFLIMDNHKNDIFVHYDDLEKAGITRDRIKNCSELILSFEIIEYAVNKVVYTKAFKLKEFME